MHGFLAGCDLRPSWELWWPARWDHGIPALPYSFSLWCQPFWWLLWWWIDDSPEFLWVYRCETKMNQSIRQTVSDWICNCDMKFIAAACQCKLPWSIMCSGVLNLQLSGSRNKFGCDLILWTPALKFWFFPALLLHCLTSQYSSTSLHPSLYTANGTTIPSCGSTMHLYHLCRHQFTSDFLLGSVQWPELTSSISIISWLMSCLWSLPVASRVVLHSLFCFQSRSRKHPPES